MQAERKAFKPSSKRDTPAEENLRLFELLLKGDKQVEAYCLRAKASYDSVNGKEDNLSLTVNLEKFMEGKFSLTRPSFFV